MGRRGLTVLALLAGALAAGSAVGAAPGPPFRGSISPIGPELRAYMKGRSWRPGCPVPVRDLRLLRVVHRGFDGRPRTGRLVVHADVARDVLRVMRELYRERFPIRRMRLVDDYGASDFRSIEADNTSAFNCRPVAGTTRWSEHAYGRAIDVNPIENPYVDGGRVYHAESRPYVERTLGRPGMILAGGAAVRAFASIGWGWGGSWGGAVRDYQHFSASGR